MYKKEERKGERRRGDIWDFLLRSNATSAIKRRERGGGYGGAETLLAETHGRPLFALER